VTFDPKPQNDVFNIRLYEGSNVKFSFKLLERGVDLLVPLLNCKRGVSVISSTVGRNAVGASLKRSNQISFLGSIIIRSSFR